MSFLAFKKIIKKKGVSINLLQVIWRNTLEEDFGFCSVNIGLHPFSPRSQRFLECYQPIHVVISSTPELNKIPPTKSPTN